MCDPPVHLLYKLLFFHIIQVCQISLVFCRKDLCEAKHEMQSVFKFSDVLFALKSDGPQVEASSGQEW